MENNSRQQDKLMEDFEQELEERLEEAGEARRAVSLKEIKIRTDTELLIPCVSLGEGHAKVVVGGMADFIEVSAVVNEKRRVPLFSFGLFSELGYFSPGEKPALGHSRSFIVTISGGRQLKTTLRAVAGQQKEPVYELEVKALKPGWFRELWREIWYDVVYQPM